MNKSALLSISAIAAVAALGAMAYHTARTPSATGPSTSIPVDLTPESNSTGPNAGATPPDTAANTPGPSPAVVALPEPSPNPEANATAAPSQNTSQNTSQPTTQVGAQTVAQTVTQVGPVPAEAQAETQAANNQPATPALDANAAPHATPTPTARPTPAAASRPAPAPTASHPSRQTSKSLPKLASNTAPAAMSAHGGHAMPQPTVGLLQTTGGHNASCVSTSHGCVALNPDVTQDTIRKTICVVGYTRTVRPAVSYTNGLKLKMLRETGHKPADARKFELDHIVPLALGGHPRNPSNLQLQPWEGSSGAIEKDKLETRLQQLVCKGQLPLATAQSCIATNWQNCAQRYPVQGQNKHKNKHGDKRQSQHH